MLTHDEKGVTRQPISQRLYLIKNCYKNLNNVKKPKYNS